MDTYRGSFSDSELGGDFDADDLFTDDGGREPPPAPVGQDERRMQVRAYNHWAGLLGDRTFPSIEDLEPEALPDFGPFSVLLDFTAGIDDPAIRFLGEKLAAECGATRPLLTLGDVPSRSLLSRITDHYMQILANQAPIGFEAEFVNQREKTILYRGILLPFSSDDDTIDFIYGVINWKELADQQTTDALMREIDRALEAAPPRPPRAAPAPALPAPSWADGPAEDDVLDLGDFAMPPGSTGNDLPEPAFGLTDEPASLADWLAAARELAEAAHGAEDRTRHALYAAIGRAYDFALAAAQAPAEFAALVAEAGLTVQERAPLTPVVKLVFGAAYDKTRLTEYAAALGHARRHGLARGELARYLAAAPGGLKGVVGEERRLRRAATAPAAPRCAPRPALAARLRAAPGRPLATLAADGAEFALLVVRRSATGAPELLGEVVDDPALLTRAARHLVG